KARAPVMGREIGAIGEHKAKPDDKPAHGSSRIAIGASQPPEERRRTVGAAYNGLAERKKDRAEKRTNHQRAALEKRRSAGRAKDQSAYEDQPHEQRAVDCALDEARPPMFPDHLEARRTPAEPVESNA